MSTGWGLTLSALLLAGNAFFVAAEFALVAAKRHRLEEAAARGSRAAQAAVAGVRELSVMLAGAQLGITLCTLGLGALAEPAIAHVVDPLLHAAGLPEQVSYAVAFAFALALVTFLHMVVGEMAPKSWAITDPQRSATLLAIPFRMFTRLVGPVLTALNGAANAILRLCKVTPVDELAQAHGPEELRMLIETSREQGTLPAEEHQLLSSMLRLQETTVSQIAVPWDRVVTVAPAASAWDVERISRTSGRSRLVVAEREPAATVHGVIHVRDAVRATTIAGRPGTTAAELALPAHLMPAGRTVLVAVRSMRETRNQLAVVVDDDGLPTGVVALEDLLEQVIGPFEDETDHLATGPNRRR
jgi:CBS domain containing-hemolysin-like protein